MREFLPEVELQGHRGARGHAPENTLAGFASALAIGVHTLELDVCLSRDGEVMVHHDLALNPDLARDSRGRWVETATALRSLSAAELARYDVGRIRPGSEYDARFPLQRPVDGAGIPSLRALCQWLLTLEAADVGLNVEVKSDPVAADRSPDPTTIVRSVVTLLRELGLQQRAQVQSFDWRIPLAVQSIAPQLATAYLSSQRPHWDTIQAASPGASPWTANIDVHAHGADVAAAVAAAGGHTWCPDYRDLDAGALARARALGLRVLVWTVNEHEDIEAMLALGVDGIISDYPDRVRAACARRGIALPPPVATPA
jgi:glycerophosphoryl diester phosphodiesterase